MKTKRMTIGQAAKAAGLTPFVIRAWEKRYGLTHPVRTDTNRRLYSKDDVRKLTVLAELTNSGYAIGQLADHSTAELEGLLDDVAVAPVESFGFDASTLVDGALRCVREMDAIGLHAVLHQANLNLSKPLFIRSFLTSLLHRVGDLWERGDIRVAHEHMCAASVRSFLSHLLLSHEVPEGAPSIIVCTPKGQEHEIGALAAAFTAKMTGWNVCYLGANMPAEEIAAGATQAKAVAVLLSISYPTPDIVQFDMLRKMIPQCPILVGGRVVEELRQPLLDCGCHVVDGLDDLPGELRRRVFSKTPSEVDK